ncbi:MAG: hypothetical protein IT445_04375 [Phycisphaeraceae bacterium]|nr:hypothetical protein [Phycisphaeraceae bacterium]
MFRSFRSRVCLLCAITLPAQAMTTYHVGNSLTWDSRPMWQDDFAAQKGLPAHSAAWHIRCGSSLAAIVANPTDVCADALAPYGLFANALPNYEWDAITLQSYPGGTTLGSETAAALSLINLARQNNDNLDTPFFLLTGWPQSTDFVNTWNQTVVDDDNTPTVIARQYYELLLQRLRNQTDADIYIIPSGEVLYQLDLRMHNGQVPGFSDVTQLYRDVHHLTTTVGRYVAGTTMFAALYGMSPQGLTDPEVIPSSSPYSPELYAALNEAVWDVVSDYPYSNIFCQPGDADGDGLVNLADLQILGDHWQSSTAIWSEADFNGDGLVNLADLQILGDHWGYGAGADSSFDEALQLMGTPVPEPGVMAVVLLSLCLWHSRKRTWR